MEACTTGKVPKASARGHDALAPGFDVADFHRRWLSARIAALNESAPRDGHLEADEKTPSLTLEAGLMERFLSSPDSGDPAQRKAWEAQNDRLQRAVFDKSRKLAKSLSSRLELTFEVQDFEELLTRSDIPCFQGEWSSRPNARILTRAGCDSCPRTGANACDYWREALDGLVVGLGDTERLARHASVRHGDSECVDVFYTERVHNKDGALAWGPLPEHMALDLFEMASLFQHQTGVDVDLRGFREGVLFFEFRSTTDQLCGNAGLLASRLHGIVKEKFPGIFIRDITPQSVFGSTEAGS